MAEKRNGDTAYQLPFEKTIQPLQRQIEELLAAQEETGQDYSSEVRGLREQYITLLRRTYENLSAWQTVLVSRHPNRPLAGDYIETIVRDWVELHGDRRYADDHALRCGLGQIGTERVALLAQHKGRGIQEKLRCNFGCAHPEGYRKALRVMKLAEKFRLPVVSLIDTAGAYPGLGSEERGVAEAIAVNLREMSLLRTPILCVVIGEGGSGGALGIGVGDRVGILQYAYYSVISPEGCASILWRTGEKASEAAEALRLTPPDLKELDIVDDIVPEPLGGAHRNHHDASANLERYIVQWLRELKRLDLDELLDRRYARWRRMGKYLEGPADASLASNNAGAGE
jgi:acetyl-CoA carboxylase carboxyl transferase subunit alpha